MNKPLAEGSVGGVEDIISELHERGVKSGKQESERILAEARMQARDILGEAETERDRIIGEGRREAERIEDAAKVEADGMLESFMASLPDIFARRASRLLDGILADAFDVDRRSETITAFLSSLDGDKERRLKEFFSAADAASFLEGLLVMAVVYYSDAEGFDHFTLDGRLRKTWARLLGHPDCNLSVSYEFREGICGFSVRGRDGREIVISPECVKHMAEAWAGDEFRDVYVALKTKDQGVGD